MLGRIGRAVAGLRGSWSEELDEQAIRRACVEAGHTWRERKHDPVTTVAALAEAYGLRWTIETSFAHLKTTMKLDVLRCQIRAQRRRVESLRHFRRSLQSEESN
jgi:hypothetical protein